MKKNIILATVFIIVLIYFAIVEIQLNKNIEKYFFISNKLSKIEIINNQLDNFISNKLDYTNFDEINKVIINIYKPYNEINNIKSLDNDLYKLLNNIYYKINNKISIIKKLKSLKAVLNNSTRFMQNIKISDNEFLKTLITIMKIDTDKSINYNYELIKLNNIVVKTNNDYIFKSHALKIFSYYEQYAILKKQAILLNIKKEISTLNTYYNKSSKNNFTKNYFIILLLFAFLVVSIIWFLISSYFINKQQIQINRFTKAVDGSDNSIIITDYNRVIKYVNKAFLDSSEYTDKSIIGQNISILKSNLQSNEFYENINETIFSGKKWSGTFKRKDKNSNIIYEKSTITPIFENGKIIEFMTIKLDITEDIDHLNSLRENEKILFEQSKMAGMGEMISNIAHQWRQPLSAISTISTGNIIQKKLNLLNDEDFISSMNKINDTSHFLSNTIDDFRNFFKKDKSSTSFNLNESINSALNLVSTSLEKADINIIRNENTNAIFGLKNELIQVLINIINNSKDALIENNIEERFIYIDTNEINHSTVITIKDNANGIPDNIIKKVFEPYFTTKHKSQGTGIGLYMSFEIITQHMNGNLIAENITYEVDNKQYTGAQFTIKIPKNKQE